MRWVREPSVYRARSSVRSALVLAVALAAASCSTADDATVRTPGATAPTTIAATGSDADDPNGDDGDAADDDAAPPATIDPARPIPTAVSDVTDHWLGLGTMAAGSIELFWSEVEGDVVVHQIFRFDAADVDPATVPLELPVHEGIGTTTWVDTEVEEGSLVTYVMRVIADDTVLERRWATALAVDDTTPPSAVTGLRAEVTTDGVLLEWDPSTDDVELGSYGVYRSDASGRQYVGGPGETPTPSFLDTAAVAGGSVVGPVSYEVVAFDFHGNASTSATVAVELG